MRKFHYLVTIELDEKHLEEMVKEDPELIEGERFEGVTPETFVDFLAKNIPPGIDAALKEGLGDVGECSVKTVFAGECK